MNLMYDALPETVDVDGKEYPIVTDFREWIRFVDIADDKELSDMWRLELYSRFFTEDVPKDFAKALRTLVGFFACEGLPQAGKPAGGGERKIVFSYKYDAGYILAAFRQTYNMDLRNTPYLHWWEFRWLFDALPDDTAVKERIGYRSVNTAKIKDHAERSRISKIQRAIALPHEIGDTEIGNMFGGLM